MPRASLLDLRRSHAGSRASRLCFAMARPSCPTASRPTLLHSLQSAEIARTTSPRCVLASPCVFADRMLTLLCSVGDETRKKKTLNNHHTQVANPWTSFPGSQDFSSSKIPSLFFLCGNRKSSFFNESVVHIRAMAVQNVIWYCCPTQEPFLAQLELAHSTCSPTVASVAYTSVCLAATFFCFKMVPSHTKID